MSVLVVRGSYIDALGVVQELLFSTRAWSDPELGDAQPRIAAGSDPEYRSRIAIASMGGRGSLSFGRLEIVNIDGEFDHWINGEFYGRRWEFRDAEPGQTWDEAEPRFVARVKKVAFQGAQRVQVSFRNAMELLDGPVQVNTYPLDTPNPDLREQLKPTMIGVCEHVPTDLYDAVGLDEERYYVADNFNGTFYTSGDGGGCKEGLATIPLGTGAGEYQQWEHGFDVNKHVTLPLTALWAKGPRKRLIHWLDAHFSRWEDDSLLGQIPGGDWEPTGVMQDRMEITRFEQTDSIMVYHNQANTNLNLRYQVNGTIEHGKDYVLRIWTAPVDGWSNRVRVRLASNEEGGGSSVISVNHDISADDGTLYELPFNHNGGANESRLIVQFRQHAADVASETDSQIRILRIQLLPVVESGGSSQAGGGTSAGIMTKAHELVPYLALERGRKMLPDLPPDFEQGPLHPTQIEYQALEQVSAEYPGIGIAWWWNDGMTHAELFDLILTLSHNAPWRFDRQDRLTANVVREPESYTGDSPESNPVWESQSAVVAGSSDETELYVPAPAGIESGDLILLFTAAYVGPGDPTVQSVTSDGFTSLLTENISLGSARPVMTILYKVSSGFEPGGFSVKRVDEVFGGLKIVLAVRVSGADRDNPVSAFIAEQAAGSDGIEIPALEVPKDKSHVISVAIQGGVGNGFDDSPDTQRYEATNVFSHSMEVVSTDADAGLGPAKHFTHPDFVEMMVGATLVVNPELPADPKIFSDRFDIAQGTLQVNDYDAPKLTTRMHTRRNFRPIGEGESAEINVPQYIRQRYRREWVSTLAASGSALPDAYSHARTAKPRESAIAPFSAGAHMPLWTDIQFHSRERRWVSHHRIAYDGGSIDGGEPGLIRHPRFALSAGEMYIAVDTRHLRQRIEIAGLY